MPGAGQGALYTPGLLCSWVTTWYLCDEHVYFADCCSVGGYAHMRPWPRCPPWYGWECGGYGR